MVNFVAHWGVLLPGDDGYSQLPSSHWKRDTRKDCGLSQFAEIRSRSGPDTTKYSRRLAGASSSSHPDNGLTAA